MTALSGTMPALARLEADAMALIDSGARLVQLKAGQAVFAAGMPCESFLLVRAGSVRVSAATESGRELLLYRVGPGESCVLTTSCLMSAKNYDAEGVAETDTEAVALPRAVFERLLGESPRFRHFVFESFGERLTGLIALVQEVSLRQVDRRLARFLVERSAAGEIAMTHQEIAAEIGTAREVVSRLLKHFEALGYLHLDRRRIAVIDPDRLSRLLPV